jgi:hypothetical protein
MRVFHCDHCSFPLFFENIRCERCGHTLAYLPDLQIIGSLGAVPNDPARYTSPVDGAAGKTYRLCENYTVHNVCNWAVPDEDPNPLCRCCRLTRVLPDLSVEGNQAKWLALERAKRRLVYALLEFGLPVRSVLEDADTGLAFHFLSDVPGGPRVLTGHAAGTITMNIAEADDVERERRRLELHEPYRTLLGHFRHESGHYYWDLLIRDDPARLESFRKVFGDERADYDAALRDHYANGPRPNWHDHFVSEYAAVHPWEDWAETWAHYLHMTDALETAAVCGLSLKPARPNEPAMDRQPPKPAQEQRFDEIIDNWFPLTYVLNSLNRGMGLADAYPFVLSKPTIEKLRVVHESICVGVTPMPASVAGTE